MNIVKIVLIAFGLFFMLAGVTISLSDSPTYAEVITPILTALIYVFYGFAVMVILGVLIAGLRMLLTVRGK